MLKRILWIATLLIIPGGMLGLLGCDSLLTSGKISQEEVEKVIKTLLSGEIVDAETGEKLSEVEVTISNESIKKH